MTPSYYAAMHSPLKICRVLLKAGDDAVTIQSTRVSTLPPPWNAQSHALRARNPFDKCPIEIHKCDTDDKTALHYAAEHADPTVFHMLLQAGTGSDTEGRRLPKLSACPRRANFWRSRALKSCQEAQ